MRSSRAAVLTIFAAGLLAALVPTTAQAQNRFGLRTGVWTDNGDPFVGAELLVPIEHRWFFDPNVELVFGDVYDLVEVSGDFHYDLDSANDVYLWAGAGPALLIRNYDRGLSEVWRRMEAWGATLPPRTFSRLAARPPRRGDNTGLLIAYDR